MTTRKEQAKKLQKRFEVVKEKLELRTSSYIGVYEFHYGLVNTAKRKLLYNIWTRRQVDEKIISQFEKLVK